MFARSRIFGITSFRRQGVVFNRFCSTPKAEVSYAAFGYSIKMATVKNNFPEAKRVFTEMRSKNILRITKVYNIMIRGYLKLEKNSDEAEKLVAEMKLNDLSKPDIYTYNLLIDGFVKLEKFKKAELMFKELEKEKIQPDIVTYNSMLDGYSKSGKYDEAKQLFNTLKEKNQIDIVTIRTMLNTLMENGESNEAIRLFREMKEKKEHKFDSRIYNVMVDGLLKNGKQDEANKYLKEMRLLNLEPDAYMYTSLMDNYFAKRYV